MTTYDINGYVQGKEASSFGQEATGHLKETTLITMG